MEIHFTGESRNPHRFKVKLFATIANGFQQKDSFLLDVPDYQDLTMHLMVLKNRQKSNFLAYFCFSL